MATKKILYLTAGPVATSAEVAEIAIFKTIADAEYELIVQCGAPKASVTGITFAAVAADNSYTDAGATITAGTISASSTDNSISDSGNGFVAGGFQVGDAVTISGFTGSTANNATRIATSVAAGKIIFAGADGDTIVTDPDGESVTCTAPGRFLLRGFKVGDDVMVRGFTTTANNISTGIATAVTAGKLTIGGTDGDGIANESVGDTVTICTTKTDAQYGTEVVVADYLAGTITEAYKTSGTPTYTLMDVSNPPDPPSLIGTQTVLSDSETIALDTAGTVTVTVLAGAITAAEVGATEAVVTATDTLALTTGGTVTFGVTAHAVTGDVAATEFVVSHGGTVAVKTNGGASSDNATATVSAHAMSVALPATQTVVQNADTTTISSKSISLAVGSGALGVATFAAATDAAISNGATVAVVNSAGTATDNATAAVAVNAVTNVALPATKTVVETADTITLDGVSVPLVVGSGALAASTLIATGSTSKVITSGVEIPASGAITSKVTVTIVDGVITACVGG